MRRHGTSRAPKGRILAVKWGLNPNSSSLGVDVTFLLLGASALALTTPIVSAICRARRYKEESEGDVPAPTVSAPNSKTPSAS